MPLVEPRDGDPAVGGMQGREQARQGVHRVRHGAAVPPGVQVAVGADDLDVQSQQPLRGHRERRFRRTPHPAVRGDHQIGREFVGVPGHVRSQMRATDLLLALEQERDVQRQRAVLGDELPHDLGGDVDRALVVGGAAAANPILAVVGVPCQLERRALPFVEAAGGLHVVMAVHQHRRPAWRALPVGHHRGVAAGLHDRRIGEVQPGHQPLGSGLHRLAVGVTADARDRHIPGELGDVPIVVGLEPQGREGVSRSHGRRRWRSSARSPMTPTRR